MSLLVTGDVTPEEDETIWHVPLFLKTIDANGKVTVDWKLILSEREMFVPIPNVKEVNYKLNADSAGVCEF